MQKRIFIPTQSPEDWQTFLADPEKQWKQGYSARSLAYAWESANGFPHEIKTIFQKTNFAPLEILLAIPEYQVALPGGGRGSQNDLFVLAKEKNGALISIAVEGKVSETFGQNLKEWKPNNSTGKKKRFNFLKEKLDLENIPENIRYQLLHRSASAILEAERFNAKTAIMLVHSFHQELLWFDDFANFAALYDINADVNKLHFAKEINGISFYMAWAKGDKDFLLK